METIPVEVLGNILEFTSVKTILNVSIVNHRWDRDVGELYGEHIHELRKVLGPILFGVSDSGLYLLLQKSVCLKHEQHPTSLKKIIELVGDTEIKLLRLSACLHFPNDKNEAKYFQTVSKILGKDCHGFFTSIIQGETLLEICEKHKFMQTFLNDSMRDWNNRTVIEFINDYGGDGGGAVNILKYRVIGNDYINLTEEDCLKFKNVFLFCVFYEIMRMEVVPNNCLHNFGLLKVVLHGMFFHLKRTKDKLYYRIRTGSNCCTFDKFLRIYFYMHSSLIMIN
jgi:hypothetical protein